jgi:predicted dehydrogenase
MRFGIISTAKIARTSVVPAIQHSDHEVTAIASRDAGRAAAVAEDLGIPRAYGSYEALLADDDLDAVYNPLPNALHAEWTKRAADAGLHVLCEKPFAVDASEADDVFDYCASRDVTVMEAFMYRFHPRTERAAEVVAEELGDVQSVTASFTFALRGRPDDVRLAPDLAGGSAMDVGCYAVSAARLFLGEPDRVYARTTDSRDAGVDTQMTAVLEYDSGATARVASGFDTPHHERYRVETTDGYLVAEDAFGPDPDQSVSITYGVDSRTVTETFDPVDHYRLQVDDFAEVAVSGDPPRVDRAETVRNMAVLDAVHESAAAGGPVAVDAPE